MVSRYIRSNILGLIAIFIALGGVGVAAGLRANSVKSKHIKNGQVKSVDVADNGLTGTDINEATLSGVPQGPAIPTGPAGGDLSGTYPDPQVPESGLVPGGDLSGTLANAEVGEAGLFAGGDITGALNATSIANNSIGVNEPAINADDEITDGGVDSEDVQNNILTNADISDADTLNDAEIDDVTRSIQIPANALVGAALAEPAGTSPDIGIAGNSTALFFDQTTLEAVRVPIRVPLDRVAGSDLEVSILWSATGGVGTSPTWHYEFAAVTPGSDAVNVALTDGNQTSSNVPAANRLAEVTFAAGDIPGGAVANGDLLLLRMFRDASNSGGGVDDLAQDAALHMVEVSYTAER